MDRSKIAIVIYVLGFVFSVFLQFSVGDVQPYYFSAPLNYILLLLVLYSIVFLSKKSFFVCLGMREVAGVAIAGFLFVLIFVGFAPAVFSLRSWYFVYVLFVLIIVVGHVAYTRRGRFTMKNISFWVNHWGLFLFLFSMLFAAADNKHYHQQAFVGERSSQVYTEDMLCTVLPFGIEVEDFEVKNNGRGGVDNYEVRLRVGSDCEEGGEDIVYAEVNSPGHCDGYDIYLQSYDVAQGEDTRFVVLKIVKQPWRWLSFVGCIGLILGSVLLFVERSMRHNRVIIKR